MYILNLVDTCGDYGIASILSIVQKVMGMIQIVVPIALLVGATWMLVKMMLNPDEKKNNKALINCVAAALIVIFLPMLVNVTMAWLDDSFSVTACWNVAKDTEAMLEWNSGENGASTADRPKDVPGNTLDDYKISE